MLTMLARNWWLIVLRGVLAIVFGTLALLWPAIALEVLVLFFGAWVLVDGIFTLVGVFRGAGEFQLWPLLQGIAGIVFGLLTFFYPEITAVILLWFIAAWALVTGVLEIVAGIRLRNEINGEWLLILGGVLSIVFGVAAIVYPAAGALAVIWMIAAYSIVLGAVLIAFALRLRGLRDRAAPRPP